MTYLEKLNPEQRRAVEHGVGHDTRVPAAPLLVIAGRRIGEDQHRCASGGAPDRQPCRPTPYPPDDILPAGGGRDDPARRAHLLAGLGTNADVMTEALTWAGTFHAIGARLLREYAEQIGIDPAFTIHDREDLADLMNLVRHELGFSKMETRFPTKATCLAIYSRAVNAELPLNEVLRGSFPWCAEWERQLRELFAAYVEAKQAQNVLDYDDLLLYWAQTASDPVLAADMSGRFDHVLVDEYQDTNRLQSSILLALKPDGAGLTVVGDDAQSIYSFRAATVRNILDFPGRSARRRRSSRSIATTDRRSRSSRPPTVSLTLPQSGSPRISGRTVSQPSVRVW